MSGKQTREHNIKFIIDAIEEIEGVKLESSYFDEATDEQLERDADWYAELLLK